MLSQLVLIILIILILDSFVSASEAAIFSVPITRVKQRAQKSRNARVLLSLKENMEGPIVTLISLSNLITIIGSVVAGMFAARVFGEQWLGLFAAVLTFLIMILAEIIPKRFGERYAEQVALFMATPIKAAAVLFSPVTWFIAKITSPLAGAKGPSISREELAFLADLGLEEGVIDEYENHLIRRVFRLGNVTAGDMMTPKPFVFSLDGQQTLDTASKKILYARHSRIPVYEEAEHKIIGYVHQRDLLRALAKDKHDTIVKEYMQRPLIVPSSRLGDDLLRDFLRARTHLAIVVSDFGNMVGVIGLEDVLEEIVGEIIDEKDIKPEFIKRVDRETILAHGQTHIPDVDRFLNTNIKSKKTLNGFLLSQFGRLPDKNETIELGDVRFTVEEISASSIEKVRVENLKTTS